MIDKRNGNFITKNNFFLDNCSHSSSIVHANVVYIFLRKIIHNFTTSFKTAKEGDVYIVISVQKFRDLNVVTSVVGL